MKRPTITRALSLFIILAMASCAGSRNFSFKDAYKFKTIQYAKQQSEARIAEQTAEAPTVVEASVENAQPRMDLEQKIRETGQKLLKNLDISEKEASTMTKEEVQARMSNLSKKEKRTIRKELKKDIREIKEISAEVEDVSTVTEVQKTAKVEGKLRTGIIIGGIGLLLMLIAGIFGIAGALVYVLGALAFITGLILILIDVL